MKLGMLLFLLLAAPAFSQTTVVRFATLPPDCRVACSTLPTRDAGPGWIKVEVPPDSGVEQAQFHLFKEGYESHTLTVPLNRLVHNKVIQLPSARDKFLQLRPVSVSAVFHTQPTGAKIWIPQPGGKNAYLGRSGEEVHLNLATLLSGTRDGAFVLKLTAPGYQDVEVPIAEYLFGTNRQNRWPVEGSYAMLPTAGRLEAARSWIVRNPTSAALYMLLGAMLLLGLNHYGRRFLLLLNKARELEQLLVGTKGPVHLTGARIGEYRLRSTLGTGGTSTVYRACRENEFGKEDLAIKVLSRQEFESRLVREVVPLLKLNHPSLVALYDWGVQDGFPYIVMEHVAGRTLRQDLQGGPLQPDHWSKISESLISGLIHAHRCGVVHGDVKPENVLLPWHGRAKLADFGLASLTCSRQSRRFGGTPGYIAPETMKSREVTYLSDQYSLGVVLYEALVGVLPARSPRDADLKDPLLTVLWKMMEEEPANRFSDLEVASEALRDAIKHPRSSSVGHGQ